MGRISGASTKATSQRYHRRRLETAVEFGTRLDAGRVQTDNRCVGVLLIGLPALFGPGLLIGAAVAYFPSRSRAEVGPGFKTAAFLSLATVAMGVVLFVLLMASAPSTAQDDMAGLGGVIVGAFMVMNGIAMFVGGGIGTLMGAHAGADAARSPATRRAGARA
jgi:hypothetical protein